MSVMVPKDYHISISVEFSKFLPKGFIPLTFCPLALNKHETKCFSHRSQEIVSFTFHSLMHKSYVFNVTAKAIYKKKINLVNVTNMALGQRGFRLV